MCHFDWVSTFGEGKAGTRRHGQIVSPVVSADQAIFQSATWPNREGNALCRHCECLLERIVK